MGIIIFFLERYTAVEIKLNVKVTYEMNYEMNTCKNMAYFFFKDQFSIPNITTTELVVQISSSVSFLNFPVIIRTFCFYIFFNFYSLYWRQRYHGFT